MSRSWNRDRADAVADGLMELAKANRHKLGRR